MFAYQRVSGWVYNSNFTVELMVYIELVDGVKIKQQTKLGGPPCTGFPLKKKGIEWASALCRRPPLCGGGRAGSVNKTTGEVKTFKTYTKQTGGSSS